MQNREDVVQHHTHAAAWSRTGTARRVGVVTLLALLVSLLLPSTGQAQDRLDVEALGVEVEVGYDSQAPRSRWVPVTVTMSPTRLFAGEVGVVSSTNSGTSTERRDVEVSAGSSKRYRFLVPLGHDLTVTVTEPGTQGLTLRPDHRDPQGYLVGVLGETLPRQLPPLTSYPLEERGQFVRVPAEWLEHSSRALDSLSALVVTPEQLGGLSDTARLSVSAAVVAGMDLVVTTTAPGPIDLGLPWEAATAATAGTVTTASGRDAPVRFVEPAPTAWSLTASDLGWGEPPTSISAAALAQVRPAPVRTRPEPPQPPTIPVQPPSEAPQDDPGIDTPELTPATTEVGTVGATRDRTRTLVAATNAGRGRLAVTGVALGEGELGSDGTLWSQVLQPTVATGSVFEDNDPKARIGQIAGESLRSDSFSLPPIPLILAFLVAYLLIIGPVNGVVLSRLGRRELAWVTIPALTIVFSGGAFLASAGSESGTGLSGRAAYWIDGVGTELDAVAVRAPRQGAHELTLPGDGWDLTPGSWTNRPAEIDRSGGDTVFRTDLEALQVGTAIGYRDLQGEAPLSLDLDPIPDGVRATVLNSSSASISDVTVRAGTLDIPLEPGTLEPGQAETIDLVRDELPIVRDWHDDFAGLRDNEGVVTAPRSLQALLRYGVLDGNPGIVWATGVTRQDVGLATPLADGSRTDDQGSFVAVGVTPGSLGTDTFPWEADRDFVTTGFGQGWRPGPLAIEGRLEAVLRFRFPHEGRPGGLTSTLERGQLQGNFGEHLFDPVFQNVVCIDGGAAPAGQEGDPGPQNICGPADPETGELIPAEDLGAPPCPPEASNCDFSQDGWTHCFPDGSCQGGGYDADAIAAPQKQRATGLEIYAFDTASWVGVGEAGWDDPGEALRFVSPLGESYVRVTGELHPFDYSGRGLRLINGGTA